jgi:hypothetical protein
VPSWLRKPLGATLLAAAVFITSGAILLPLTQSGPGAGCTGAAVTTATFAARVSSATPGDVLCLSTGNYGTWAGAGYKDITVKAGSGQSPAMQFNFGADDIGFTVDGVVGAAGSITNSLQVTVQNSTFAGLLNVTGLESGVVLDHNDYTFSCTFSACGTGEGKINVDSPTGEFSGVTISNSTFADADYDGIHLGSGGADILNNTFRDLCQNGVSDPQKTDSIQFAGNQGGRVAGNLFVIRNGYPSSFWAGVPCEAAQTITSFAGIVRGVTFEDNVIDGPRSWALELDGVERSVIRHNTLVYRPVYVSGSKANTCLSGSGNCGIVYLGQGPAVQPTHDVKVYANVMTGWTNVGADTPTLAVFGNLCRSACSTGASAPTTANSTGTPTFAGGIDPSSFTSYTQFCLAAGSPGKGTAVNELGTSDSSDMGIRCGNPAGCTVNTPNQPDGPDPWGGCFPGPSNTGVPTGTVLTLWTGGCNITTPGLVIDSKIINCPSWSSTASGACRDNTVCMHINAANVTIRNSWINGAVWIDDPAIAGSFAVTDSTFDIGSVDSTNTQENNAPTGIGKSHFVATRVETFRGGRGIWCEYDCTVQDSYVHEAVSDPGGYTHESGIRQGSGGPGSGYAAQFFTHNTLQCQAHDIDNPPHTDSAGCSADMSGYGDFDFIQYNTVSRNLFMRSTGGTCAYGGNSSGRSFQNGTHNVWTENIFQRGEANRGGSGPLGHCGYAFGIADFNPALTGNVFDSTNKWDDGSTVQHDT